MNVTVFGASGQTGLFLVERALGRGYEVTAYVRTPEIFPISHENLKVVKGDVRSRADVARTIEGADAVLCAVGERLRTSRVCSAATENIIDGMKQHGVRRPVTAERRRGGSRASS
jgi:putative NADH-flavin reductase